MGRPNKLWWWAQGNCWASKVRGKRERLGDDPSQAGKAEAQRELHRLLGQRPSGPLERPLSPTVANVVDRFNDHARATLEPTTTKVYHRRLADFRRLWGGVMVSDVRPFHVNEWVGAKEWANPTKRVAIAIIRRAFAWAMKEGYIDRDPTVGVVKPPDSRREFVPSASDVKKILDASPTPQFRQFLDAIIKTGCRPGEAAKVTAADFDPIAGTWTVRGKTTKKTGKMRVVYLPPSIIEDCKRLAVEYPDGPLYRNFYGRPWNDQAYGETMRRIREKLGMGDECVLYAMRHAFATDALERGVPIATVAELLGHSSTAMISKAYSHLSERASHLRDALAKIRPEVSEADTASSDHASESSDQVEQQES